MEGDLLYDIKTLSKEDVLTIFMTIVIDHTTTGYIYTALSNPYIDSFLDDIVNFYVSKKVYNVFYDLLDGWEDHLKNKYNNDHPIKEKLKTIITNLLRTDELDVGSYHINLINTDFNINYYAETMAG